MRALIVLMAALIAPAFAAATGQIVDVAFVEQAIKRDAIVWDVRDAAEYRKGHIPGAINFDDAGRMLRDPNSEDFIPTARIEKIFGDAGLDPSREVVVYATRGSVWSYFGLFALEFFGAKKAFVFHEGIDGWRGAGKPVSTEPHKLAAITVKLVPQPQLTVSTAEMRAAAGNPGVQIVDARTPREYSGEDIRAIRGGHIPSAINIPYEQNWSDPDTAGKLSRKQVADNRGMSLKAQNELRQLYARLDPAKETIVYCQSGVRAAETAYVLKELGFSKVKVYDASWLAYGNTLDAPANNATFFNVGALNGRMAAMQARIEQLEKDLTAAKANPIAR